MKFCTVIVLLKTDQNTERNFQNMTYDVIVTSLLKQRENSDLREARQIEIIRKEMMRAFRKSNLLLKFSD